LMDKDIPEVQAEAKVYKNNALIFFTWWYYIFFLYNSVAQLQAMSKAKLI
jgi:hypothetical protein